MKVTLLHHTPLSIAVTAARTCWDSFSKGGKYACPSDTLAEADIALLDRLIHKNKHESIAEHCHVLCEVKEPDLLEWFKQNHFSYVKDFKVVTNLRVILENKELLKPFILEVLPKEWQELIIKD
jgi:hypothetical protein